MSPNNEILRLLKNIKIFLEPDTLDAEFKVFAAENPDLDSVSELNDIMEEEISYFPENY